MDIERINENTLKFFISYVDVEERGFDREEIWYSREKSEQLFWEVMDEVNEEEDFPFDGPLWIQVQALEKGLEVLVTKAQFTKDGGRLELPFDGKMNAFPITEQVDDLLDDHFQYNEEDELDDEEDENSVSFIAYFTDFDDLIPLASRINLEGAVSKLFSYENRYYLYVEFPFENFTEDQIDDYLSILLEYGLESHRTIHYLQEYGNEIISENVFETIRKYFS
jgi:adapter protein MecA 1/2